MNHDCWATIDELNRLRQSEKHLGAENKKLKDTLADERTKFAYRMGEVLIERDGLKAQLAQLQQQNDRQGQTIEGLLGENQKLEKEAASLRKYYEEVLKVNLDQRITIIGLQRKLDQIKRFVNHGCPTANASPSC